MRIALAQCAYWTAVPWPPAVAASIVASISAVASASWPRKAERTSAAYGATRAPVASVTASASATSRPARSKSPLSETAWPSTLTPTARTSSAPASRATWTSRVATSRHVSKSQTKAAAAVASQPQRSTSSTETSGPANAVAARCSTGAAAGRPSVNTSAKPSSSRSLGRGGCGGAGAVIAACETSRRPAALASRPANSAALQASRYVSRDSRTSSGSSVRAAWSSSGASSPRLCAYATCA